MSDAEVEEPAAEAQPIAEQPAPAAGAQPAVPLQGIQPPNVVIVTEPAGDQRICTDLKELNKVLKAIPSQ